MSKKTLSAAGVCVASALSTAVNVTALAAPAGSAPAVRAQAAHPATLPAGPDRALLEKYCFTCHNDRLKRGELSLTALDPEQVAAHASTWEKSSESSTPASCQSALIVSVVNSLQFQHRRAS